jgi:hypothetical protein
MNLGIGLLSPNQLYMGRSQAWALPIADKPRNTLAYNHSGTQILDNNSSEMLGRMNVLVSQGLQRSTEDRRPTNLAGDIRPSRMRMIRSAPYIGITRTPNKQRWQAETTKTIASKIASIAFEKYYGRKDYLRTTVSPDGRGASSLNNKTHSDNAPNTSVKMGSSISSIASQTSHWNLKVIGETDARMILSKSKAPAQVNYSDGLRGRTKNGSEGLPGPVTHLKRGHDAPSSTMQELPVPSTAAGGGDAKSFVGELYLDGSILGAWITRYVERVVTRPSVGPTALNVRSTATWPGSPLPN